MTNDLGIKGLDIKALISALEDALAEEYLAWYAYSIEAPFLTDSQQKSFIRYRLKFSIERIIGCAAESAHSGFMQG